jgi:hypothetical protein
MTPSRTIYEEISTLLSADTATLAAVTAMKVSLVVVAFAPSLDLVLSSLTLASFTGSTPLSAGTGTQTVYYDPTSGLRLIEILQPAGGWTWTCTATPSPAQTVYGVVLTDHTGATLYGSMLLPTPIPISAAGQGLNVDALTFSFLLTSPM